MAKFSFLIVGIHCTLKFSPQIFATYLSLTGKLSIYLVDTEIHMISMHTANCEKLERNQSCSFANRKDDLILNMTPEKQDKTSELSKQLSPETTPARNKVIMKTTYPVHQESVTKSALIIINECML